jgi:hypothetical protein
MMAISLLNLSYIITEKPYEEKRTNQIEAFNEVCILMCNYLMQVFVEGQELQMMITLTWVFIGVNLINVGLNIIIIIYDIIIEFAKWIMKLRKEYITHKLVKDKIENL